MQATRENPQTIGNQPSIHYRVRSMDRGTNSDSYKHNAKLFIINTIIFCMFRKI